MSPEAVSKALSVLGLVGIMGLFLPDLDKAWDAQPGTRDAGRVRRGEQAYLAAAVTLGGLAAYGQGSVAPLVLCTGLAVIVVVVYESALRSDAPPVA